MSKPNRSNTQWAAWAILLAAIVCPLLPAMADDEPAPPPALPAPAPPPAAPAPMTAADAFQNFNIELNKAWQALATAQSAIGSVKVRIRLTGDSAQVQALLEEAWNQVGKVLENLRAVNNALDDARKLLPTRVETRLLKVEHANVEKVAELLTVFQISGCQVVADEEMQVLAVSGPADAVQQVEDAVKLLDKPTAPEPRKKNIELLVYVLEGHAEPVENAAIPDELKDVTTELSRTFRYPSFILLDTLLMRCRDGESTQSVNMLPGVGGDDSTQQLKVDRVFVTSEGPPATVRLDEFVYNAEIRSPSLEMPASVGEQPKGPQRPYNRPYRSVGFNANLDVQEGLKVVVGKANMGNASTTMFVVVTVRVVDPGVGSP